MISLDIARHIEEFDLQVKIDIQDIGITSLFGPSGSGKTTLVNIIAGLVRPDRGRIATAGRVLFDSEAGIDIRPEARRLGYVFQDARLFPHMTVVRNLTYGMNLLKAQNRRIGFDEVIALLDLGHLLKRRPAQLSGGERQRVAIGRALLSSPDMLLMDEPLASLDGPRKNEILPFIQRLPRDLSMPVVYVSHMVEEVIRLADEVVVLHRGRVQASGSVEEIMSRPDLAPLTGRFWAGSVLRAEVLGHDTRDDLTTLAFPGGSLVVPRLDRAPGSPVRVRIRARDVAIALKPPEQVSVLNVIPGTVIEVVESEGGQVDLVLDIGCRLLARITAKSRRELAIAEGTKVYAMIKAVNVDRPSISPADQEENAA